MSTYRIMRGRVERWAAHYHGEPFHALLCDPPYALTDPRSPQRASPDSKQRNKGFMGKEWDNEIAFDPDIWAALASHLLPGAFGMCFASSRGWHRLACAIEDAGMIIHPSIFGWCQSQGFPKATRVNHGAEGFSGHRYGLQALKPSLEPIIVWQKPYAGKPAACITETGAGALWIDGGRIRTTPEDRETMDNRSGRGWGTNQCAFGERNDGKFTSSPAGRWPANFFVQHLPGCNGACAPGCPVATLGEQSGESTSNPHRAAGGNRMGAACYAHDSYTVAMQRTEYDGPGDTGTAARFFFQADWSLDVAEQLAAADPVRYVAKASRRERDAGLEAMPRIFAATMGDGVGEREHNPSEPGAWVRNPHPCVKPITLTRWLATLLLPPAAYAPRRLLVPFAGSGSECIGAALVGWEYIMGIDAEREYVNIARARLAHWCQQPALLEAAA